MKKTIITSSIAIASILVVMIFVIIPRLSNKKVTIVAPENVQIEADFLHQNLKNAFKNDKFGVKSLLPEKGDVIVMEVNPELGKEEYSIISKEENSRIVLNISAGSNAGLHYAVSQLLEHLGFGFFLSFETLPEDTGKLNLRDIHLTDRPLTNERIVFNWHNFLSGCSSWNFEEWKLYIDQSAKMRFNGLMTHFYANDPTFIFSHNGVEKIPGFMPNTQKGRQYGTQQVNDVRRLFGGDVFNDPVFGSKTSKVADENRVAAAHGLIQKVHDYATSKHMNIWFGLDIDAQLANPQEIMQTLPESAKIKVHQRPDKYFGTPDSIFYLPIPDSPEGYNYYKSQMTQLFQQFPEIDHIVLWTRTSGSPFLTLQYESFPANWKLEFDQFAATNNKIDRNDRNITGRFATSKIYAAVRQVMNELNKNHIKLWAGSWRTTWLEKADWFYPKEVGFIPLDYYVNYFSLEEDQKILSEVSKTREMIPVVWAHHDDGAMIGSPYEPYENLQDKVESAGNSGVGIIHWTTKPLDIYFKNVEQQIWGSTRNASLKNTADFMAERMVKEQDKKAFSDYLVRWLKEGPRFGRETRTWFIDHQIDTADYEKIIEDGKSRIELLSGMNTENNAQIQYFKGLEEFCIDFYHAQYNYQEALNECQSGNFEKARELLSESNPEKAIKKYAEISKINGITLGEKGVIVEMNLSWLPLINSLRQTLRLQSAYINFGNVNFPDLGVGLLNTNYIIDGENRLWRNIGEDETGGKIIALEASENISEDNYIEIAKEGFLVNESIDINLIPFAVDISPNALKNPDYFMPGKYSITLIFGAHEQGDLGLKAKSLVGDQSLYERKISIVPGKVNTYSFQVELGSKDAIRILLESNNNTCFINGVIIEPIDH